MKRVVWLLLFALLSGFLIAQDDGFFYNSFSIPDSLKENASSVIREYDQVFTVGNDGNARKKVRKIVTLLDSGSSENELSISFDKDRKITQFKVVIYDLAGKKVREVKKSEINEQLAIDGSTFHTDNRVRYITIDYPNYPYTIAFEYELKLNDFAAIFTPFYQPQSYSQSVSKSRLVVDIPADNKLVYDAFKMPEPKEHESGGRKRYSWSVNNLTAKEYEPYSPEEARVLPSLVTSLEQVEVLNGLKSSFSNWQEYGKLQQALYAGRDELPAELKNEVETLIADAGTDKEKIDRLYRFMQERMRYVSVQLGIGGWQPFSAEYVENNRYGDCKALSNYMKAILEVADIESYPTIIYSGREYYKARPDFTSPYGFNHVILYVPSEEMYLECTSNYFPTGYLGSGTMDRNVVWLTPEGGELKRTPAMIPSDHGHVRTQQITLGEDGSAALQLNTRYVGAPHEVWRYMKASVSEKELKERLHHRNQLPDVSGSHFKMDVSKEEPIVDLDYTTTLPRYARKMGKRFFVPLNKLFAFDHRPPKIEDRQNPVVFERARFLVDSVKITLPEGLVLESLGKTQIDIEHEAGEYHATLTQKGNEISWVRTLKINPVRLKAEEYADFRDFYLKLSKAEKKQLVFKSATR